MRVCLHILRRGLLDLLLLLGQELDLQLLDDRLGDFVLNRENVGQVAVVAGGPEMAVGRALDQFRIDPDPVAHLAHAALDDIGDAEFPGDALEVLRPSLVGEDRVAAQHEQAGDVRHVGDDVLGDAVAEKFLLGIVAQIGEGQDRQRRLVGAHLPDTATETAPAACGAGLTPIGKIDTHRLGYVLDPLVALIGKVQSSLLPTSLRTAAEQAMPPGGARPCSRTARFTPSPWKSSPSTMMSPRVDAHAEFELPVLGHASVALGHAALDLDGTARGVEHAGELDQETVAHHLEDASAMPGDDRIEELAAMLAQAAQRLLFIGLHEAAVADHVGGQDGRQPPLYMLLRHAGLRKSAWEALPDRRFSGNAAGGPPVR